MFTNYLYLLKVAGNIETKYKCSEYGISLTEKWNTDNTLNATLDIQVKLNTIELVSFNLANLKSLRLHFLKLTELAMS